MSAPKSKIISYRKALWLNADATAMSLGGCLSMAIHALRTVEERKVSRGGGQVLKLAKIQGDNDQGYYLHITAETPGESTSIIPKADETASEISVSTTEAPEDTEFMDGDAFAYIHGNDVCICTTGLTDASVRFYLQNLFSMARIRNDAPQFDLIKAPNLDKISFLMNQGVKEIEISAVAYKASADYHLRQNHTFSLIGSFTKAFKQLLGKEHDVTPDGLKVYLTIKADARSKGLAIGYRELETLAVNLIENQQRDDDFVIITKSGQKIKSDEIFVKTEVHIESHGKSVDRDATWKEIAKFHHSLKLLNALEE